MEGEISKTGKYVAKKINKIRWQPVSNHVVLDPTVFATGSWDDKVSDKMGSRHLAIHCLTSHGLHHPQHHRDSNQPNLPPCNP